MVGPVVLLLSLAAQASSPVRPAVAASEPAALSVTVYRDPERAARELDREMLSGIAMINETRDVVLPAGPVTIRFEGVAEGMVGVTAIVSGLPGGTLELNRSADLLSPAALVDGTLGNRVTLTRTNPATGTAASVPAIIRTRADGGLVLQTRDGYEAVRCSGLPEKLSFSRVPAGLSARPIFSVDTDSPRGGRYRVTLSYLASGFDWQANYIATLDTGGRAGRRHLRLVGWMTLGNENGQGFPDATLLAVAGKINVDSDYRDLAESPKGRALSLHCFDAPIRISPAMAGPASFSDASDIIVTARRVEERLQDTPVSIAMLAKEEALGDLKLYRVPEHVTVASKSLKQVAFLDRPDVSGRIVHSGRCSPYADADDEPQPMSVLLRTTNDAAHGLGLALPGGRVATFEPTARGELLLGEQSMRDYASGEEVELPLSRSSAAFVRCAGAGGRGAKSAALSNANPYPVTAELRVAKSGEWAVRDASRKVWVRDGWSILAVRLPAHGRRTLRWRLENIDRPERDED